VFDLVDKTWSFDTLGQAISCMAEVEAQSGDVTVLQVGGGTDDGAVYLMNTGLNDIDIGTTTTAIDSYCRMEFGAGGKIISAREIMLRCKAQDAGDIDITVYENDIEKTDKAKTLSMIPEVATQGIRRHRKGTDIRGDHISMKIQHDTVSQDMYLYDLGVRVHEWTEL